MTRRVGLLLDFASFGVDLSGNIMSSGFDVSYYAKSVGRRAFVADQNPAMH